MNRTTGTSSTAAPDALAGLQLREARKGTSVTQHDYQVEREVPHDPPDNVSSATHPEDVTREQGGQFSMESGSVAGPPEDALEAKQDASMLNEAVDTINALQVTMDRSGAEHIHAQKAFLTNSGAKSIDGRSSKLTNSGVLQLRADRAEMHQSSAVMATCGELRMESGSIIFSNSDKATIHDGAHVSVLQARSVEAAGNIRAFMLVGNSIKAGGNVETAVDIKTAAAFGAALGAVLTFLWKLIGQRH